MTLKRQVIGMAKATHFGPTVLVVTISFILSITQLSFPKSIEIALAILAGQCVVGWTNDLIDHPRDSAAGRLKKALVNLSVSRRQLHLGITIALTAAVLLSFLGPLGVRGGLLHMLGLASATLYNFGLKSTWISPLPYAISFGAMPWAVYSVVDKHPPTWLYLNFALVSVAFHFLNVIKDLEWDRTQAVMGLPQRVGKRWSIIVAVILIAFSIFLIISR
jgi:4-hydroxybenzoate polyprenyltransferase